MYVTVELQVTEEENQEKKGVSKMFLVLQTNLRVEYLYVQINIDEGQHVVYVMHVYDNQPKMMKLVPTYR